MAAINAENITNLDLAKNYIDNSLLTNHSSIEKKYGGFSIITNLMLSNSLKL